ncbi:hypothetical protein XvhCFBP2543_10950 [Xanthomonas vasicola]|nr:hypothetical protein XvhCFBP2543_10950 [Xanthomonas vasicola]
MEVGSTRASPRTLTPTSAPRPGPRLRRGRSKARAPLARKPCLLAPRGRGALSPAPLVCEAADGAASGQANEASQNACSASVSWPSLVTAPRV